MYRPDGGPYKELPSPLTPEQRQRFREEGDIEGYFVSVAESLFHGVATAFIGARL